MLFNGVAVKFEDVAKMCLFFMKNEDNLYPPEQGFKGAALFKNYMYDVLETREIPKDRNYDINKNKLFFIRNNNTRHNIFGLWSLDLMEKLEID